MADTGFSGDYGFSVAGLFQSKMSDLIPMTAVGLVVTMGPTIAYKAGVPIRALKYLALLALCGLLAVMASNASVGIYMTYALPMVFSIFYYDRKLTLQTAVFSFMFLVISLFSDPRGLNLWRVRQASGGLLHTAWAS